MKQQFLFFLALTIGGILTAGLIAAAVFVTFTIGDSILVGVEAMKQ
jgi:hypothetical protein